jgi:predicted RNA-binding protein YlqC (UPF0109 family)
MKFHQTFKQLVASLCTHPQDLKMEVIDGKVPIFTIIPHGSDYGALCGKGGNTVAALNTIASAMTNKAGGLKAKVFLDNPHKGDRGSWKRFTVNPSWTSEELDMIARLVASEIFDGAVQIEYLHASVSDVKMVMFAESLKQPQPGIEHALATVFGAIGGSQGMRVTFELEQLTENETRRI